MDAKKILLTIFMLFAINELFSQGWDIQTGTWLSPHSDTKNFGVKKSFQVTDTLKVRGNFGVGTLNPVARVHFRLGSNGFSTFGLVGDSSVQFSTYDSTTDVRYLLSLNGYSDIFSITRDSTGAGGDHSISINSSGVLINGLSPFQNLSISNDTLSIENGNSVVVPSSAAQTLSIANDTSLSISGGNTVTIPCQQLSISEDTISISGTGGNSIVLPGWILIETQNASGSATIDFTGLSAAYSSYVIIATGISPQTTSTRFYIRFGTGGTPTYQSGASDYAYVGWFLGSSSATPSYDVSSGVAQIQLNTISNTSGDGYNLRFDFPNPSQGTSKHPIRWEGQLLLTNVIYHVEGSGAYIAANTPITAIRFFMSSGNIASGNFKLYGIK